MCNDAALVSFVFRDNAVWYLDYTPTVTLRNVRDTRCYTLYRTTVVVTTAINPGPLIFLFFARSLRSALTRRRVTIGSVFLLSVVERNEPAAIRLRHLARSCRRHLVINFTVNYYMHVGDEQTPADFGFLYPSLAADR